MWEFISARLPASLSDCQTHVSLGRLGLLRGPEKALGAVTLSAALLGTDCRWSGLHPLWSPAPQAPSHGLESPPTLVIPENTVRCIPGFPPLPLSPLMQGLEFPWVYCRYGPGLEPAHILLPPCQRGGGRGHEVSRSLLDCEKGPKLAAYPVDQHWDLAGLPLLDPEGSSSLPSDCP